MKFKTEGLLKYKQFYFIFFLYLLSILFTHPFLRYPYDMYFHLSYVDFYSNTTRIPHGRHLWHYLWASFFNLFGIEQHQIFLKAKLIYYIQTYIALFSIYFFSNVIIRNIFFKINTNFLQYLSLWSTFIWWTVYATQSMYYHLTWNIWYSISYQITLPLFFYITSLTIILALEKISIQKKLFFTLQIIIISIFIIQVHSMEFMYYIMYLLIFSIIYFKKIFSFTKLNIMLLIFSFTSISLLLQYLQPDKSQFFTYLSYTKLPLLYEKILLYGEQLVHGYNRSSASINEFMYLSFYTSMIMVVILFYKAKEKKQQTVNIHMFIFLILTSLFISIPLFQFSSGLAGVITKITAVNRIYYSSSLFILLPISIYYLLSFKNSIQVSFYNTLMTFLIMCTIIYSYYSTSYNHNYYKNIHAIYNSFFSTKFNFNLSEKEIHDIGIVLNQYDRNTSTAKPLYFYARDDISFVIKFIYRRDAFWHIHGEPNYKQKYMYDRNTSHTPILFKTPENFSHYHKYD